MSSTDSSPAAIPLAAFVEHREIGQRVSASLSPFYKYMHIATTLDEASDAASALLALEPAQRARAWVVGGAKTDDEVEALRRLLREKGLGDMRVLRVPKGTLERVGGPNMPHYVMGLLDSHFRQ